MLDANDNAPVFKPSFYHGSIKEGSQSGIRVTQVTATDQDTASVQLPIVYRLGTDAGDMFVIDKTTGVVTTGQFQFSRLLVKPYLALLISAVDPILRT